MSETRLTEAVAYVCAASAAGRSFVGTVVLTDDAEIAELNAAYRGIGSATDVLAFALHEADDGVEGDAVVGDVVVSVETAARAVAAAAHGDRVGAAAWDLPSEIVFLVVHGVLHLLGHDHGEPDEEAVMRAEERRVFAAVASRVGLPSAR